MLKPQPKDTAPRKEETTHFMLCVENMSILMGERDRERGRERKTLFSMQTNHNKYSIN